MRICKITMHRQLALMVVLISIALFLLFLSATPLCPASAQGDPAQRKQSLIWSKAGNEYVRFNEVDVKDGGSGVVSWLRLKILTRDPEEEGHSEARECSVCLGTDTADAENDSKGEWTSTACSHNFHSNCLANWKSEQQQKGHCANCPMCRQALA